ncbi:MAG: hypothetical protein FWC79_00735 [Oscillospiraceae bacterium]|nr:hypothetical protein [Oscillospiraceae bacterium]
MRFLKRGGIAGIGQTIGNYNNPYITLIAILTYLPFDSLISIKVLSLIFDYICAFAAMAIVYNILKTNKNRKLYAYLTFIAVIFLPTVVLNSSAWAQSDAIYVAFMLISLAFLLEEKYFKSFIFLGIAFAFKLQFIFILPLFVLLYISNRKFPIYYFLIIPVVNFILSLPAIIAGRPFFSFITIYLEQTSTYTYTVSRNFPSFYSIFFETQHTMVMSPGVHMSRAGILFTLTIFVIAAFIVLYKKVQFDKERIIEFALWSIMISTFFLPQMHDRYLFAGDIISIIYFAVKRKNLYIPLAINFISLYTYTNFLYVIRTNTDVCSFTPILCGNY